MSAARAPRRYLGALRELHRDGIAAADLLAALTEHLAAGLGCPDVRLGVDHGRALPAVPPPPTADATPALLGQAHEALLEAGTRRRSGAHYTPPVVAERLVAFARDVRDRDRPVGAVVDPAVGGGAFLLAAAAALATVEGVAPRDAAARCFGIDIDPLALAVTRATLELWAGEPVPELDVQLVAGDALLVEPAGWRRRFDLVIGNPPFLNQLQTHTARARDHAAALRGRYGELAGGYVDAAALFLLRGLDLVRAGGQVVLIQPHSTLATRDTAGVRDALLNRARLAGVWFATEPVFRAGVRVWAPVLDAGGPHPEHATVARRRGPEVAEATSADAHRDTLRATWSPLVADLAGVPEVRIAASSDRVGGLATATAGFRDQFYGLARAVMDAPTHDLSEARPRLVTVGLIDVLACRWGERATRFAGAARRRPVVDLAAVPDDLHAWVQAQLRPKLVVATQTKVLEVAVDEDGTLVPSTPVIAVHAAPDRLWHLAAALSAPPVTAHAMRLALGTALVPTALKLSAKQVLGLPLPVDHVAWDDGAALARDIAGATDPGLRRKSLTAFGAAMCAAYDVDPAGVLDWWLGRIG